MSDKENTNVRHSWPLPHLRADAPFVPYPVIEENNRIFYWLPEGKGKFINLQIHSFEYCYYFSKEKRAVNDAYIEIIDFIVQKIMYFRSIARELQHNIENLLILLNKIDRFYKNDTLDSPYFITSEIETIFISCRKTFDVLQKMIAYSCSNSYGINDENQQIKIANLPESFNDMYLPNESNKLPLVKKDKYRLPSFLTSFYLQYGEFFQILREMRDDIMHRGIEMPWVSSVASKGLSINLKPNEKLVSSMKKFNVWKPEYMLDTKPVPILPILAHCVYNTIEAGNALARLFKDKMLFRGFPPDISPGYHVYFRTPFTKYYSVLKTIAEENIWSF